MRTNQLCTLCAFFTIASVAPPAQGQCTLETLGEWDARYGSFTCDARNAYVARGAELVAFDLTSAMPPLRIGELRFDGTIFLA